VLSGKNTYASNFVALRYLIFMFTSSSCSIKTETNCQTLPPLYVYFS
jgi:hypothetical protein